jgi:hypothetical protein
MRTLNGYTIKKYKGFWLSTKSKIAGLFKTSEEAINFSIQQLFINKQNNKK